LNLILIKDRLLKAIHGDDILYIDATEADSVTPNVLCC